MDVAFIQNTQQHVDHQYRGYDENKLRALRLLKRSRLTGIRRENGRWEPSALLPRIDQLRRLAQRCTRRETERYGNGGPLAGVIDRRGTRYATDMRHVRQRYELSILRSHLDLTDGSFVPAVGRGYF